MNLKASRKSPFFQVQALRLGSGAVNLLLFIGLTISSLTIHQPVANADNFLEDLNFRSKTGNIVDVSKEPTSLAGSFLAAQAASSSQDNIDAIEHYRRAIELDPENHNLKQALFSELTSDGQIAEAIELLKLIPVEKQTHITNHVVAGSNALKQKSWAQALARIDRIEGRELDMTLSAILGAWALFGERKIDEALTRLDGVAGQDWQDMLREFHAGLILGAAGRDEEAQAHLERAVELRGVARALTGAYMRAIEALARIQARRGDFKSAIESSELGLSLLNGHPPLVALKKKLESDNPKIQPLISTAEEGASEMFFDAGTAISRQGGLPFALGHIQLARFLSPKTDAVHYALANIYSEQKKFIRANEVYASITQDSPYYQRAQLEYALNLNQLKQTPLAIEILNKIVEADPLDLVSVLSLGGVYAQHKQYENAIGVYSKTLDLIGKAEARHWPLFYRRAISYERVKQWPEAEADFKRALELSPNQADVLNYLGYSWIDQGIHLDEGLDLIKKAVSLQPDQGFIIDSLGWAYYRLGQYEEAVVELEKALRLMPSDPVVIDHLGDAYWKVDRKLEASFQWKHALTSDPSDADRKKIEKKLKEGLTH